LGPVSINQTQTPTPWTPSVTQTVSPPSTPSPSQLSTPWVQPPVTPSYAPWKQLDQEVDTRKDKYTGQLLPFKATKPQPIQFIPPTETKIQEPSTLVQEGPLKYGTSYFPYPPVPTPLLTTTTHHPTAKHVSVPDTLTKAKNELVQSVKQTDTSTLLFYGAAVFLILLSITKK